MQDYKPPLSLYFVWHPADAAIAVPLVDHCSRMLQRDVTKPFSRAMNLPIFLRTTSHKAIPSDICATSKHVLIFAFVSTEVAADNEWTAYMEMLSRKKGIRFIAVAIDNNAYSLNSGLGGKNFIRLKNFEHPHQDSLFFINVSHEIYRYALNEHFSEIALGKDNAVKLFLSHSKRDDWAVALAIELKHIIDNSAMRNFFDAIDIAPGYNFDSEIVGHIKESTMVAIHSDSYSSRYWCQREMMCAKESKRPILAVDCLDDSEDRRFTYSTNIPAIHVMAKCVIEKKDILRILSFALLETVRLHYNNMLLNAYKDCDWFDKDTIILPRPPEATDVLEFIKEDRGNLTVSCNSFIYPEPTVYVEEHNILKKLNISASTPITFDARSLAGISTGISISNPTDEELIAIGQDSRHLIQLSQDIARHLLARNSILIYGGDLRPGGFTEFVFEEATIIQDRMKANKVCVYNYIAWPIYKNDTDDLKLWKAKYRNVASMVEIPPPSDVSNLIPSHESYLPPTNTENLFIWSRCLTEMRNKMINQCTVRICAGGKHSGYMGILPGVLQEIIIAIEMNKPIYLVGGFGGITTAVCQMLRSGEVAEQLTLDWQIQHNAGYNDLLDYATEKGFKYSANYDDIARIILEFGLDRLSESNGLTQADNLKLFDTPFADEAVHLILKGLKSKICS